MTVIIDYGLGNLFSIQNMLKHIGEKAIIANEKRELEQADRLILPGVGAFDEGVANLMRYGLKEEIKHCVTELGKPILGICLGMQLLGKTSEEGYMEGLSLLDFDTMRFRLGDGYKIPHMGWERVHFIQKECKLLNGIEDNQRYYFVHSYHACCNDESIEMIRCEYGYGFAAAVHKDNVYGVQFHPEKSHRYGMSILLNFARIS